MKLVFRVRCHDVACRECVNRTCVGFSAPNMQALAESRYYGEVAACAAQHNGKTRVEHWTGTTWEEVPHA